MCADVPRPARSPRIVAHRGASGHAPENTLAAFRAAAEAGAGWVEFDVCLLGDGTAVLHHDATLERCTDATGPIGALDAAALAGIDAGASFGAAFAGERIPRLEAALAELARLGLGANLELKPHGAEGPALADTVARILAAEHAAGRDWARAMTVSSFDHAALVRFRAARPEMPVALLYKAPAADWRETAAALGAEALHLRIGDFEPAFAAEARAAGLALRTYTANDPSAAAPLRAAGLGAVITDHPDRFLADPAWAAWAQD
ncbi:MAG: glycerophosphodiester phosphodiesterase family protein [Pseudomonadota bacterium]